MDRRDDDKLASLAAYCDAAHRAVDAFFQVLGRLTTPQLQTEQSKQRRRIEQIRPDPTIQPTDLEIKAAQQLVERWGLSRRRR